MITVDRTGKVLGGRYRIERRLGAGGMGVVYEGLQLDLGRRVAIKILEEVDEESLGRFRDEATLAAALVHPNVVAVNDLGGGEGDEPPFIVMELLEGLSLHALLDREKKLSVSRALSIASQILAALEAAHGARILHRDIKPSNIWITSIDDIDHVKVLDFGIARMIDDVRRRTHTGSFIGTPSFMAPEVIIGADATPRSDLFAVGVVLYRMLSGQAPFKPNESSAVVSPSDLRSVAPDVPAPVATVVMRALSKDPGQRPASAREMRDALRARPAPTPAPSSRAPFAIALVATLGVGAAVATFLATRPPTLHTASPVRFPSLAIDASAPPVSSEVPIASPASTPGAGPTLHQCLCKDEYGDVACSKRGKARCECYTTDGFHFVVCSSRAPGACGHGYSWDVVGVDGDRCHGWTYGTDPKVDPPGADSHPMEEVDGTLFGCNQCPTPEWRLGKQGDKCTGYTRGASPVPGTLYCKP